MRRIFRLKLRKEGQWGVGKQARRKVRKTKCRTIKLK